MQPTNRHLEVLDFIKHTVATRGFPPSVREIGQALRLRSTSTVHYHLTKLEKLGLIKSEFGRYRAMRLVAQDVCPTCGACRSQVSSG